MFPCAQMFPIMFGFRPAASVRDSGMDGGMWLQINCALHVVGPFSGLSCMACVVHAGPNVPKGRATELI